MVTKNEENWMKHYEELKAYVEEHHLFPNKHTRLSHKIKYIRKKINEGTLEEWKRVMFEEIAGMRDLMIHTGGRRTKDKFYVNLEETGNTESSTVMIGLKQNLDAGKITSGMKVMVTGFGVGLSRGGTVLKF